MNMNTITRETSAQHAAENLNAEASDLYSRKPHNPDSAVKALWEAMPGASTFERFENGCLLELPTGQKLRLVTRRKDGKTKIGGDGLGYDTEVDGVDALGRAVRNYRMISYDCGSEEFITAADDNEAVGKLKEWLRGGDWGEAACYVEGGVVEADDSQEDVGEEIAVRVGVNTGLPAGPCIGLDGEEYGEHDWQEPQEIVGGCKENPGVYSAGAGRITAYSVCTQCGRHQHYKSESVPGNYPAEPAFHRYAPADEETIAWVRSFA